MLPVSGIKDFRNALPAGSNYSKKHALQDTATYPTELSLILQGKAPANLVGPKPKNVSPATWRKISKIVSQVSSNAQSLNQQLAPSSSLAPKQLVWKATYNSLVRNDTVTKSAIQSAKSNGSLAQNALIADTANKSVELQNIDSAH